MVLGGQGARSEFFVLDKIGLERLSRSRPALPSIPLFFFVFFFSFLRSFSTCEAERDFSSIRSIRSSVFPVCFVACSVLKQYNWRRLLSLSLLFSSVSFSLFIFFSFFAFSREDISSEYFFNANLGVSYFRFEFTAGLRS